MSFSEPNTHQLRVSLSEPSPYASIQVYDGLNRPVKASMFGSYSRRLKPGLYRIEVQLNNLTTQETPIVVLNKDTELILDPPKQYSSVPLAGFGSSYDYYTQSAEHWSRELTFRGATEVDGEVEGALFIFFRFANQDRARESGWAEQLGTRFSIWQQAGEQFRKVTDLRDDAVRHDTVCGCMAFHMRPSVGTYFLACRNEPETYTLWPLYLTRNWQTQLFMTFDARGPLFDSLRILLARPGEGFQPDRIDNKHLDNAVLWLQNGLYTLPASLLRAMEQERWDNPMLYLVVAHMLMIDPKSSSRYVRLFVRHVETLLNNKNLPGLKSLKFLLARKEGKTPPKVTIDEPPLLQPLLEAIIHSSASHQDLIEPNSLTDLVATQLSTKSPWTSFDVPIHALDGQTDAWNSLNMLTTQLQQLMLALRRYQKTTRKVKPLPTDSLPEATATDTQPTTTPARRSAKKSVDLQTLAQAVQLPPSSVRRVIETADQVLQENQEFRQSLTDWLDQSSTGKQTSYTLDRCLSELKGMTE